MTPSHGPRAGIEPGLTISELMAPVPLSIPFDVPLREALRRMDEYDIRHLPVLRDGVLIGVLSDRDLLEATGLLSSRDGEVGAEAMLVLDGLQHDPVTVAPEDPATRAAELMLEWTVGCLPVLRGRTLVGLVTETDLMQAFASFAHFGGATPEQDPPVERVMTPDPVVVDRGATLAEAARAMAAGRFRHVPVVEDDVLLGLLSDRDLRLAAGRDEPDDARVADLMATEVVTTEPGAPLSQAARRMVEHRISALPVEDERSRLVGILSATDVLEHCARVLG